MSKSNCSAAGVLTASLQPHQRATLPIERKRRAHSTVAAKRHTTNCAEGVPQPSALECLQLRGNSEAALTLRSAQLRSVATDAMTSALFGTSQLTMPSKTSGGKLAGGKRILSPLQHSRPITPMQTQQTQTATATGAVQHSGPPPSLAPLASPAAALTQSDSSTPPPLPSPKLARPRSGLASYRSSPSPSSSMALSALPSLPNSVNSSRRGSSNDPSLSSSLASSLASSHAGTPAAHSPAVYPPHSSYSAHFGAGSAAPTTATAIATPASLDSVAPSASLLALPTAAAALRPGLGLAGASAQLQHLSLQPPLPLDQLQTGPSLTQSCPSPHSHNHSPLYRGSNTPSPSSTARRMQLPAPPPPRTAAAAPPAAGLPVAPGALVVSSAFKPTHGRVRSHSGDDTGLTPSMQPPHPSSPQLPLRGSKAVAGILSGGRPASRAEATYL